MCYQIKRKPRGGNKPRITRWLEWTPKGKTYQTKREALRVVRALQAAGDNGPYEVVPV